MPSTGENGSVSGLSSSNDDEGFTGWDISHCPTSLVPFSYWETLSRLYYIGLSIRLTSSAAIVTVWLVTITGSIFAFT